MKIQIKLSYDGIKLIISILKQLETAKLENSIQVRMFVSVLTDVCNKLENKERTLRAKRASGSYRSKISFKYHEAICLEKILRDYSQHIDNDYHRAILWNLTDDLNRLLL